MIFSFYFMLQTTHMQIAETDIKMMKY